MPQHKITDTYGDSRTITTPDHIWLYKNEFESRYYTSEQAILKYFGTLTPDGYAVEKYRI